MVPLSHNPNPFPTVQLEAAGGKLVVVDFHATWCGPCKMIAPHLEEMDKTMDDVVFLKVDVDECEDIAEEYKVEDDGHWIHDCTMG